MKINGFHHIGLAVTDMEKSLKFYVEGLGGEVTFQFPMGDTGKNIYLVDLGGSSVVELIPRELLQSEKEPRWLHIALSTDDAAGFHKKALEAGAREKIGPSTKMLGNMKVCNSFVYGPDDEEVEFFQVIEK